MSNGFPDWSLTSLKEKFVTPHTLRNAVAMSLLQHGVDLSAIALWLGHESSETTQIYLHADMRLKERTLAHSNASGANPMRYRPADPLLLGTVKLNGLDPPRWLASVSERLLTCPQQPDRICCIFQTLRSHEPTEQVQRPHAYSSWPRKRHYSRSPFPLSHASTAILSSELGGECVGIEVWCLKAECVRCIGQQLHITCCSC